MAYGNEQNQNANDPADAPDDSAEFEAAFSEAADLADGTTPASAAVAGEEGDDDKGAADDHTAPADQAAAPDHATDSADASQAGNSTDDIWANAPPHLREAYEKSMRDADLRYRSSQGRVSALDRELNRLRTQPGQQQQEGQQRTQEGQQVDEQSAAKDAKAKKLAELREEYPDLAEPLLDEIAEMRGKLEQLSEGVGAYEQERGQAAIAQQEQLLATQHPDWAQVATDDRFNGWLETQPTSIREAFNRNFHAIVDGADAALVIGRFKADVGLQAPAQQQEQRGQEPAPSKSDKRQRQLQSGRDAGRNGPVATNGVPDDYESSMNAWADRM